MSGNVLKWVLLLCCEVSCVVLCCIVSRSGGACCLLCLLRCVIWSYVVIFLSLTPSDDTTNTACGKKKTFIHNNNRDISSFCSFWLVFNMEEKKRLSEDTLALLPHPFGPRHKIQRTGRAYALEWIKKKSCVYFHTSGWVRTEKYGSCFRLEDFLIFELFLTLLCFFQSRLFFIKRRR